MVQPHLPESLLAQWHLTEQCPRQCRHCYQGARTEDLPFATLLVILNQIRELVAELRSRAGARRLPAHITLAGGEPFLRADIVPLLELLHGLRKEFSFAILSGGWGISRQLVKTLQRLAPRFIQLSLDGGRITHDRLRGAGDFDRVCGVLQMLQKGGVRTLVSFTARRDNFREFPLVAEQARRLKVAQVWADRFIPLGSGADDQEQVLLPAETAELFELMRHSRGRWPRRRPVTMGRALQFLRGGGRPYRCPAGDSLITILADGTVTPCRRLPLAVGRLPVQNLSVLYQTADLFGQLRDHHRLPESCRGCAYGQACGGGLRCLAHAVHGSLDVPDPGCWLAT